MFNRIFIVTLHDWGLSVMGHEILEGYRSHQKRIYLAHGAFLTYWIYFLNA